MLASYLLQASLLFSPCFYPHHPIPLKVCDLAAWVDFLMNKVSDKVKELQELVGPFNLTCPAKKYRR